MGPARGPLSDASWNKSPPAQLENHRNGVEFGAGPSKHPAAGLEEGAVAGNQLC